MIPFAIRCATMLALLMVQARAVPSGVLVREEKPEDCCAGRLELTIDGEAFYSDGRDPIAVKVHEAGGQLQVEVDGKTQWILSRDGNDWIDQDKRRWVPRETLVKTDPSWTTVRIQVVDQEKKPVEAFGYEYQIEGANGRWDPMLVRPLQGKAGLIEIKAPDECEIVLSIEHPDFTRGYGTDRRLDRKAGSAKLVAEFQRGRTIRGKVVDDATGKPLKNAVVSPIMFTPPLFSEDDRRSLMTAADGTFELRGVDFSFAVNHPDFLKQEISLGKRDSGKPREVRMKKGLTIRGSVSDPANRPLTGVHVDDGSGKSAVTGDDGRFVLNGLRQWSGSGWDLTFSKDGYDKNYFQKKKIGPQGVAIKLLPLPELRGWVARADGTPVTKFRIVCGPGADPEGFECVEADVDDNDGRFVVRPEKLPEKGDDYCLGIRAEGAAPWHGVVSRAKMESGDFRVVLKEGASLSATLTLPATAQEPIEVALLPTERQPDALPLPTDRRTKVALEPTDRQPEESLGYPGVQLARYSGTTKPGEALRIAHLRAGNYELKITCKGATPLFRPFVIGNEDLSLGDLRLEGTGSISGVVNEPYARGKPWRFADGQIFVSDEPYLRFKTDASGRFRVDGVPIGMVTVKFNYNATADIINSLIREARVAEGKDTEVRFEGDGGTWAQPLRLLFDGKEGIPAYKGIRKVSNVTDREPMFLFEVTAPDTGHVSGMHSTEWSTDEKSGPAIADLSPGRWRIRVFDWLGSRGFTEGLRAEAIAEVCEKREPITFELGGKTLSGRLTASRETKRNIQVIAAGRSSGRVFLSRCDDDGDFVIRYLPQDEYLVHAHDDEGGWCDLGVFRLDKAIVDCGVHALRDGGHAEGKLAPSLIAQLDAIHISAKSSDGMEIPVDEVEKDGSYRFGQLRPGKWTIITRADEKEIMQYPTEIRKGATAKLDP